MQLSRIILNKGYLPRPSSHHPRYPDVQKFLSSGVFYPEIFKLWGVFDWAKL